MILLKELGKRGETGCLEMLRRCGLQKDDARHGLQVRAIRCSCERIDSSDRSQRSSPIPSLRISTRLACTFQKHGNLIQGMLAILLFGPSGTLAWLVAVVAVSDPLDLDGRR